MKKMIKTTALVLAVFLLSFQLSIAQTAKTKLTFMGWGAEGRYHELFDATFKAYPELSAKYEMNYVMESDTLAKLRLQLAAGGSEVPDMMEINYSDTAEFASQGVFADLSKAAQPYQSNTMPEVMKLAQFNGKLIGVPIQTKTLIWFYRKDLFDQAGIDPAKIRNTEDFIAAGRKLHAKFPKSYIWNLGSQTQGYIIAEIASGNGARFFDAKGNYVIDTDPGVRAMLLDLKKIKDSGVVVDMNDWTPDWNKAFSDGTLASTLCAKWLADFIPDYAGKDLSGKWAMALWPSIAGAQGGSESGGSLFAVLDKSRNKAAAADILTKMWMTKKAYDAIRQTKTFAAWSPILKDAAAAPEARAIPYFAPGAFDTEMAALKQFKLFTFSPKYNQELKILLPYVDKCLAGTMSADDALKGAQKDMVQTLENALSQ